MKRFTETEKWRDTWFRKLPALTKLAFIFLVENCDASGVWEPDYELANFSIGEEVDWDKVLKAMGDRVVVLGDGKWYLTRFIEFQYGPLSEACKPHLKVLAVLKSHGIPTTLSEGYHIPFPKGIQRVQEEDKETEEDKVKDRGCGGTKTPAAAKPVPVAVELPLETPFPLAIDTPAFRAAWNDWLAYRRERKLPKYIARSEAAQLNELAQWAGSFGLEAAIESIRQSIRHQWQGLFQPKTTVATINAPGSTTPGANRHQQKAATADDHGKGFFAPEETTTK